MGLWRIIEGGSCLWKLDLGPVKNFSFKISLPENLRVLDFNPFSGVRLHIYDPLIQ